MRKEGLVPGIANRLAAAGPQGWFRTHRTHAGGRELVRAQDQQVGLLLRDQPLQIVKCPKNRDSHDLALLLRLVVIHERDGTAVVAAIVPELADDQRSTVTRAQYKSGPGGRPIAARDVAQHPERDARPDNQQPCGHRIDDEDQGCGNRP